MLRVVAPKHELLSDKVSSICSQRINDMSERPWAYIHRPKNKVAKLWNARRNVLPLLSQTANDPKSAFGSFLQGIAEAYVDRINLVLGFSPKSSLADLRCEIDAAMRVIDRVHAKTLFVDAWNAVVKNLPRPPTITHFVWNQWQWLLANVFAGCKRAVTQSIREQFEKYLQETDDAGYVYVGDEVSVNVRDVKCAHMYLYVMCACARAFACLGGRTTLVLWCWCRLASCNESVRDTKSYSRSHSENVSG